MSRYVHFALSRNEVSYNQDKQILTIKFPCGEPPLTEATMKAVREELREDFGKIEAEMLLEKFLVELSEKRIMKALMERMVD